METCVIYTFPSKIILELFSGSALLYICGGTPVLKLLVRVVIDEDVLM